MGSDTTIPVSHDTKKRLLDEKRDGETWEGFLIRLAEGDSPDCSVDGEVLDALRALEEQVSRLPERTADELQTRTR